MSRRTPRSMPRSQKRLSAEAASLPERDPNAARVGAARRGRAFGVALLVLSCALLGIFMLDGRFRVREIQVQGETLVDADEVAAATDLLGRPIFLLNDRQVAGRLSEAFGCFDRVRVQARLPDRVRIVLVEKSAMLLWENQGTYWWMDRTGEVLGEAHGTAQLPVVHDLSNLPVEPGQIMPGVPWEYVGEVVSALPAVKEYEYTLDDGLIVRVTTAGWPVYLGSAGDAAYKASVMREITAVLTGNGSQVVYIDLKNERRPAVKLAAG